MTNFGGINATHAQRAHLALIEGGASTSAATGATNVSGVRAAGAERPAASKRVATGYAHANVEGTRSRHEVGVRAVAKHYATFEDALVPMVLASGVSGEAATAVAEAIMSNPSLRAQAERAFQRARINPA
jgi:hypothetical protein